MFLRPKTDLTRVIIMRLALSASFIAVASALCPAPISRLAPASGNSNYLVTKNRVFKHASTMMSAAENDSGDEESGGPFTRKALLEGSTKAAGVLGAGTFVQKGFFAGVPYNGKPDLSGKV